MKSNIKQILLDADDTLWENNIHFMEANNRFFDLVCEAGFSMDEITKDFDELELKVVREMGYGSANYIYILRKLFSQYNKRANGKLDRVRFGEIIDKFSKHPQSRPRLFKKVPETLEYLRSKYKLFILTKGDEKEQSGKIIRSELDKAVDGYFVLPEKSDREYREILEKFNWNAHETCMVGNSPKSDINPALRSGMYAIHIPYRDTWKMDLEPLEEAQGRLLVLESFEKLRTVL
jgi:putative hydrolase of the HAD superfamily